MSYVERRLRTSELRLKAEQKLHSTLLTENNNYNKLNKNKTERRTLLNTEYVNKSLERPHLDEYGRNSDKIEVNCDVTSGRSRGGRGRKRRNVTGIRHKSNYSTFFKVDTELKRSPITTPQGYHLYLHHVIEGSMETDILTVGDHVMICLADGGERPAQITAFLYDPEKDLQGVEVRWFYSESDILNLGKIINKSKFPKDLFSYEEEYLESDKCEVLEVSVIKRMVRVWNSKNEYLKWTRDELDIYSGPQIYNKITGELTRGRKKARLTTEFNHKYHDEYLIEYIKEFNEDLLSFSVELSDNFLVLYTLLANTGTIVPILSNRNMSHFLANCSNYYGYYVDFFNSMMSKNDMVTLDYNKATNIMLDDMDIVNLHWSERPDKALPCREKEHEEIKRILNVSILSEGGGVLFIAGLPGTGKTATVLNVLKSLETEVNVVRNKGETKKRHINVCYINALHLSNPDHFYGTFLQELTGSSTWAPSKETCYNSIDNFLKDKESPVTILVIDEIDWLQKTGSSGASGIHSTSGRGNIPCRNGALSSSTTGYDSSGTSLLYTLFDWPFQKNSKLIIIAISNTMDLPERLIPRCTSRCGYARVNFSPFSVSQMIKILETRVGVLDGKNRSDKSLFCSKAIEFCARRIAQQSSDVRRALQVLHRAFELFKMEEKQKMENKMRIIHENSEDLDKKKGINDNQTNLKSNNEMSYSSGSEQVQIIHVQAACKEVLLGDSTLIVVGSLPLVSKLFLVSIVLEYERKSNQIFDTENKDKSPNQYLNESDISLLQVQKRFKTILSLIRYSNQEHIGSTAIRKITRSLIATRIIQVFRGLDTRLYKNTNNLNLESIHNFGSDIWIVVLVDHTSLKNYLSKNLPYKIPGLD